MKLQSIKYSIPILLIFSIHTFALTFKNTTNYIGCPIYYNYTSQYMICNSEGGSNPLNTYVIDASNPANLTSFPLNSNICTITGSGQLSINSQKNMFCTYFTSQENYTINIVDIYHGRMEVISQIQSQQVNQPFFLVSKDQIMSFSQGITVSATIIDSVLDQVVCNIDAPLGSEYEMASIYAFEYNGQTNMTYFVLNSPGTENLIAYTYNCTDNTQQNFIFPQVPQQDFTLGTFIFMNYSGNAVFFLNADNSVDSFDCFFYTNGAYSDSGYHFNMIYKINDTDFLATGTQNLSYYRLNSPTTFVPIYNIEFGFTITHFLYAPGSPIFIQTEYAHFVIDPMSFNITQIIPSLGFDGYIYFTNGSVIVQSAFTIYIFAYEGNNFYMSEYDCFQSLTTFSPFTDYWTFLNNFGEASPLLHINIQNNIVEVFQTPYYLSLTQIGQIMAAQVTSGNLYLTVYITSTVISTFFNNVVTNITWDSSQINAPLGFYNGETLNIVYATQKLTDNVYCNVDYSEWMFYVYDGFSGEQIQIINLTMVEQILLAQGYGSNYMNYFPLSINSTNNQIIGMLFYDAEGIMGYINQDGYAVSIANSSLSLEYNFFNTTFIASKQASAYYAIVPTNWSSPAGFHLNTGGNTPASSTNWTLIIVLGVGGILVIIGLVIYLKKRKESTKEIKQGLQLNEIKST